MLRLSKIVDEIALLLGGASDSNHLRFRCPRCSTICSLESSASSVAELPLVAECPRCLFEISVNPYTAHLRCECGAVAGVWTINELVGLSEIVECHSCLRTLPVSKLDLNYIYVECPDRKCAITHRMSQQQFKQLKAEDQELPCRHTFRGVKLDNYLLANRVLELDVATPSIAVENSKRMEMIRLRLIELLAADSKRPAMTDLES